MLANYAPTHLPRLDPYLRCVTAPLVSASAAGLAARLPGLGAAVALLALTLFAAQGAGGALIRWISPRGFRSGARRWLGWTIGLGALPLPHLGAGLLGFHTTAGLFAVLIGCAAPAAIGFVRRRTPGPGTPSGISAWPMDPFARLAIGVAAAAAVWTQVAALIAGFAPAHVSDEFVLHLGVPGWWRAHHRIVPQPGNVFSAFPAAASLLYAPWVSTGAAFGTAWAHQAAGWLGAAGVWQLLADRAPAIRTLAVLGTLTLPSLWIFAGRAFADLFPLALGAAALLAARGGRFGLAGAAVGLAAGAKYQAWVLLPMLLALAPVRRWMPLLAGALAAAAPWLLRGWLGHGDPLHPLLWNWFGQPGWDATLAARVARGLHQDASLAGLAGLPALPWLIPVRSFASGSDGTTGVLAALLVPALWIAPRPRESAALLAVALAAALTGSGLRYFLPALPLLIAVAARGWERAAAGLPPRAAAGLGAALVVWQAAELVPAGWRAYDDPLPVALGSESLTSYRDRTAYPRESFAPGWFRAVPPPGTRGRLLFAGSWGGAPDPGRTAYLTPQFDRPLPVTLTRGAAGPERIAIRFRQADVGAVLVSRWRGEIFFDNWKCWDWSADELRRWTRFWDGWTRPAGRGATQAEWSIVLRQPVRQPHRITPGFEVEAIRLVVNLATWNRVGDAVQVLEMLEGLFPGNPDYHAARAIVARARNRPAEAREAAATAARLAPRSAAASRARAADALAAGRVADAAAALQEAGRRDAMEPFIWLELSGLCHRLGRESDAWWAVREYRRAKFGVPTW